MECWGPVGYTSAVRDGSKFCVVFASTVRIPLSVASHTDRFS